MHSLRFDTLETAQAAAFQEGLRQRAVCYVTREATELLVFEHDKSANDAGVQLPAGGLEPGETPAQAAAREALEETGLQTLSAPSYLGSCRWMRRDLGADQVWHYFQFSASAASPNVWTHTVTGGEDDTGMLFHLRFVSLCDPGLTPDFGSHEYLPELLKRSQELS
ncbi:NUDIX hydrolase [Deinococcus sp.]|uniref:NUDIX hydrolase n=1 Tax=Deinococcus sp. TaxID=47478 RepID=UPI003CC56A57